MLSTMPPKYALTDAMTTDYAMIDVRYVDGAWVIDEDSWLFELDYLFGLA